MRCPDDATVRKYQTVLAETAVPYRVDAKGRSFRSEYPTYGLDAAGGLVSTANDLARLQIELERSRVNGVPLSFTTLDKMWSNASFNFQTPTGTTTIIMITKVKKNKT